ncbi:MAG TPA: TetR/AcrR family transcriptional regulator [Gordonia sp. (in: high G+C Gram-positive bacteria)]|uniref:TetR/AcrR family transcriptional regulator n=1 Tax=unclassified Gordonia (in: high G+C Gram-positive bacteria) TaxID=2657482 RepID=UPI000FAE0548|nr:MULTISPECIES: TetR/AcrR family transcriptional regulator [unclassified Gordonia (in: high G+C Gram-positive bacteria)]RUP41086.1 MAG: TetR/AcrR family transcriptional regulator [Gordonia sp. (in: high G+C Gram-positive bacteria)]HNP57973.1 TetR/AcrR family transcriptional regulator [Gordonia sp. (in: high G+C Gram-positive bacteria)]HRC49721.1 TetR/AcrR family transcriptional regulator [Gordonia sp. (in: high G+C Gram-positive bacteria)]
MQTLIANFVSGMTTRPTESDRTEALILDATGAEIAQHGFAKVSMESIAKRAGVNRATIYRRFTDRDGLLAAWAHREGIQMTGHLVAAVTGRLDTPERIRAGFVAAADFVRQNPVVRALARDNPAALIAAFCADDQALLRLGGAVVGSEIRVYQRRGHAFGLDADHTGEAIARLLASCLLIPGGIIDIDDSDSIRSFADRALVPMLMASSPGSSVQ